MKKLDQRSFKVVTVRKKRKAADKKEESTEEKVEEAVAPVEEPVVEESTPEEAPIETVESNTPDEEEAAPTEEVEE